MTQFPPYPPQPFGYPDQSAPTGKSGLAVASLILGILGFCTAGTTGLIGLILGLRSLSAINKSQGQIGGKGLAVAGVSVSASSMVIGCFTFGLVGLLLPAIGKARQEAVNVKAQQPLHDIADVHVNYMFANKNAMPPPNDWINALSNYSHEVDINELVKSPFSETGERLIAMNINLDGATYQSIRQPGNTPFLFEVAAGSPLAGGRELLPRRPRSSSGYLILFVDGHVENVPRDEVNRLAWNP